MYCKNFNLENRIFQISSDNKLSWLRKAYSSVLKSLKQALEGKKDLPTVTGDDGDTFFVKVVDAPTSKKSTKKQNFPVEHSENQGQKEEGQPKSDKITRDGLWFFRKNIVWISVSACIYMYISYLFFSGYTPYAITSETYYSSVSMKPLENQIEKPDAPATIVYKRIDPNLIDPNLTEPTLTEPAGYTSGKCIDDYSIALVLPEPKWKISGKTFEYYSVSTLEPEPGAIIEWLIEKRNINNL